MVSAVAVNVAVSVNSFFIVPPSCLCARQSLAARSPTLSFYDLFPSQYPRRGGHYLIAGRGWLWGTFSELEENKKIAQAWRTGEFPEDAEDSHVEILLEEIASTGERRLAMTKLTLIHTNIPEGQADSYKTGWEDFYFMPMREWSERSNEQ